jgi:hypothetical protein
MKKKKPESKPVPMMAQSPTCPNCGHASEKTDVFCASCESTYQSIISIVLTNSIMIRYAPLHFYNAIALYRLWQIASRRERVIQKGHIIDKWFRQNRQAIQMDNTKRQREFFKVHDMFTDFVMHTALLSQAEEKLEAMFKILERR